MARTPHWHEKTAGNESKSLPKTEPEHTKNIFSNCLLSNSNFNAFEWISEATRNVHEHSTVFNRQAPGRRLRFDCARARGSRVRPFRRPHKTERKLELRAITLTLRMLVFYNRLSKVTSKRRPLRHFGLIRASLPMGVITSQVRENLILFVARVLKHCKTHVLEGSRMDVGGVGAGLWGLGNTIFAFKSKILRWHYLLLKKVRGWLQAINELTLSVLEDVIRVFSTNGCSTRRQEVLTAARRT